MRYRALSPTGDYTFGRGSANFLINTPAAVAQAILTRLRLFTNEWFLDTSEGTPYTPKVLGKGTAGTRDTAIRNRILGTDGVTSIVSYSSELSADRKLTINAIVNTVYGQTPLSITL